MATTNLPPVPESTRPVDQNGNITPIWSAWFRQLFNRVGGFNGSPTVTGTANDVAYYNSAGVLTGEARLAKSRGGTAQDNSSLTFPSSGTIPAITPAAHGVVISGAASAANVTAAGTAGQPLLSGGASADPSYGTLGASGGGTGQTTILAAFQSFYQSIATTLGDFIYGSSSGTPTRLAGNTSTTRKFLRQVGDGANSAAPAWDQPAFSDVTGTASSSQMPAFSGDVTTSAGSTVTAIASNAVTNAKLTQMAANTLKGNNTGATANAADLTVTQATAMLNAFVGDSGSGGTKGLVPAPAAGDAAAGKFLKADGSFAVPSTAGIGHQGAVNVFTASGTFTTPSDSSSSTIYQYIVVGGGGGGGGAGADGSGYLGCGSGGGGGAVAVGTFTGVAASTGITITVNSGGGGGSAGTGSSMVKTGTDGGSVSIGSPVSVTCGGGEGGYSTNYTAQSIILAKPGAGGSVTAGSPNIASIKGQPGEKGVACAAGFLSAGNGGSSLYGSGGRGYNDIGSNGTGDNGSGYGGGGGGSIVDLAATTRNGGAGSNGIVIIIQLTP